MHRVDAAPSGALARNRVPLAEQCVPERRAKRCSAERPRTRGCSPAPRSLPRTGSGPRSTRSGATSTGLAAARTERELALDAESASAEHSHCVGRARRLHRRASFGSEPLASSAGTSSMRQRGSPQQNRRPSAVRAQALRRPTDTCTAGGIPSMRRGVHGDARSLASPSLASSVPLSGVGADGRSPESPASTTTTMSMRPGRAALGNRIHSPRVAR